MQTWVNTYADLCRCTSEREGASRMFVMSTACNKLRRYTENTFCNNCCCQSCRRFERKHSPFTKMKKYIWELKRYYPHSRALKRSFFTSYVHFIYIYTSQRSLNKCAIFVLSLIQVNAPFNKPQVRGEMGRKEKYRKFYSDCSLFANFI